MAQNSEYWGYHLMMDCSGCNDGIKDRDNIIKFTKDLVKRIDMEAFGEPIVEYLLPGDPKAGYSMLQLITTSNLSGHFIEMDMTCYLDVFSCKRFDVETAMTVVREYFGAEKIRMNFVTRQAG